MAKFFLAISDHNELFKYNYFKRNYVQRKKETVDSWDAKDGVHLFICNYLMTEFRPIIADEASSIYESFEALNRFTKHIASNLFSQEESVPIDDQMWKDLEVEGSSEHRTAAVYYCEALAMEYAINHWLGELKTPNLNMDGFMLLSNFTTFREEPHFPSEMLFLPDEFSKYCIHQRSKQVTTHPETHSFMLSDKLYRVYESVHGLLPLCWMEIWYCLEHNIRARVCPYCGRVFKPYKTNPNTMHCGDRNCKRLAFIKRKGGQEKYREWERNRKKKPGGKRGRPSLKKETLS